MDPQEDERFFEMLEFAYNTILDNQIHPEESHPEEQTHLFSTPLPLSFDFDLPDLSEPCDAGSAVTPVNDPLSESRDDFGCNWCDIPNMLVFQEPAHDEENNVAIPTFREIISRAVQLSRDAMGLAINSAICRSSYSSNSGTLTIDPMVSSQYGHAQGLVDDGAADVADPAAVDVAHVSELIATDEGSRYGDVEVLLGCYQLIAKIEREINAEEGAVKESPKQGLE